MTIPKTKRHLKKQRSRERLQATISAATTQRLGDLAEAYDAPVSRMIDACVNYVVANEVDLESYVPRPRSWYAKKAIEEAEKAGKFNQSVNLNWQENANDPE